MHYGYMRTTVNLDKETHEYASYYARVRGLTLGEALDELVEKAKNAPLPEVKIEIQPNGLPMFPRVNNGKVITPELIKQLEDEEFDPKNFT